MDFLADVKKQGQFFFESGYHLIEAGGVGGGGGGVFSAVEQSWTGFPYSLGAGP